MSADVNECSDDTLNNCHGDGICVNEVGNFSCACRPGYRGDGVSCEGMCPKVTYAWVELTIVLQISTSVVKRLMTVSTHLATTQEEVLCVENASLDLREPTNAVSAVLSSFGLHSLALPMPYIYPPSPSSLYARRRSAVQWDQQDTDH